jgi:hypothetical protein
MRDTLHRRPATKLRALAFLGAKMRVVLGLPISMTDVDV